MKKVMVFAFSGYILVLFTILLNQTATAQNIPQRSAESSAKFDLKNGDRVVFLGNSLFENDFQYGYLELALTTHFPESDVTFRNLGWTGDNVWGDARSTFTNPPTAYQHLINNIIKAQPTIVFLGYGGIEAQEGEEGLPHFRDGMNKLLDKIDSLGARTIILSPIPVMTSDSSVNLTTRNADIELYASAMSKIATDRNMLYIDVYTPIQEISKKVGIIENGVHLNETGYYYLTKALENGLGLKSDHSTSEIIVSKQGVKASANARMLDSASTDNHLKFTVQENYLPLPLPQPNEGSAGYIENTQRIKITGLKKGFYTLKANNADVMTAAAKDWEKGVRIKQGPSFSQIQELQKMILKKNDIHFFQYRPMNETYIIGFRSYEQGRHVKGLEEQNILITWLEGQIALNRKPKEVVYELVEVK